MAATELFLRSRVARRVFWALLTAALLPLALFAAIGWQTFGTLQEARQQRANTDHLKHVGNRLHDRLSAAHAALAAHAAASPGNEAWAAASISDAGVRTMLSRVATIGSDGERAGGDIVLAERWAAVAPAPGRRTLWWRASSGGQPALLWIVLPDPHRRGWWLAEIDPDFVWSDFPPDGLAAGLCVGEGSGGLLHCSPGAPALQPSTPRWRLFLGGAFDSPDWVIAGHPPAALADAAGGLARIAVLGGLATLLLIATIGLVLVRRTMVPLERLLAGTRQLAAGDWAARVDGGGNDEFGALAGSFNEMASRIGRQMQALEVQSAIDREILGGHDVAGALRRVAQRLQALAPAARVIVFSASPDDARWKVHEPAEGAAPVLALQAPGADTAAGDGLQQRCAGQPQALWAEQAFAASAAGALAPGTVICWMPVQWNGRLVAQLLFAADAAPQLDADALRELGELRDRVGVTLAAAMREHHLVERAVRDNLTGLLNRHGLHDACDDVLRSGGAAREAALLMVDLDGFKEVNDTLGHPTGDALLRAVAQRLREVAGGGAVLARYGGDEFVVLARGDAPAAQALAQRLVERLALPYALAGQTLHLGASIGWASWPEDAGGREELLRRADLAMYAAKAAGRNRARRYDAALDARAAERAWIVRELRAALDAGALQVHYQPRLALHRREVCSVEALVRWTHAQRGAVSPATFIPVAEDSGLIEPLGRFVLASALAQRRAWLDAGVPVGRVAVNVAAAELREEHFAARVLEQVQQHGLLPQHLELELTESQFAGDPDAVARALEPLRRRGVTIALDDFGTGYSSLSALQRLPVDVLKIDRSFVVDLGHSESAEAVARSIIALARALGKRVVAEGVETALQEERLLALGCDEFQGWRYARPMPGAQVAGSLAPMLDQALAVARG